MKLALFCSLLLCLCGEPGLAAGLPSRLDPSPPFPRIALQAPTIETVAPGVVQGEYDLLTQAGPIVVHAVAVAPNRGDVRVDSVLANDALTSAGETISSMARRTGAVAGINADYFDIGNTNRPANVVVRGGRLLQTPRKRYSLAIDKNGLPHIVESRFEGQVQIAERELGLDGVNQMPPPNGGISLITPEFGSVPPSDDVTLVAVAPVDGTPPFATYRVSAVSDNLVRQPPGYYLAIGINAYGNAGVPNPGDAISVSGDLAPFEAGRIRAAVGGGPMILQNGEWYEDADGPTGGEYSMRIPSSGAAIGADGTLFLVEVDGRQPAYSVGVTRPEFAALMRALGGQQGLAFDGGGSSEIVARDLGAEAPSLQNVPSDGRERPVADGIFVYSDASDGPPEAVVARPGNVRALAGTSVPLEISAIDANDHAVAMPGAIAASVEPVALGEFKDGTFTARRPGTGALLLRSGSVRGRVPLAVYDTPARVAIVPEHPNVAVGGRVKLSARAFDRDGFPIALPPSLRWSAAGGSISEAGEFAATARNAQVAVAIGGTSAKTVVTVGSHDLPLPFAESARFMTVPAGGTGAVTKSEGAVTLQFQLGPGERAAYAASELPLPQGTLAVAFDILDDGSGARVRIAVRNAINEQILATALTLDHPGWRHAVAKLPLNLAEPARLSAIYVIGANGATPAGGSIAIKNVRAVVAGSP